MARASSDWVGILVIWLAGLGAAGQYAKISVVFDRLPDLFPGGGAGLGWVLSLVGFVGIALGVVAGVLVARLGFRRVLIWSLIAGGALSLAQGLAMPLGLFLGTRVLEGAAHLGVVVAAPVLIAGLATDRQRAGAMTLWSTFFSVAFVLLAWLGAPLILAAGPRGLFVAHGIWMLAVAGLVALAVAKQERPAEPPAPISLGETLWRHVETYRSPFIAAPALGWLAYTMAFVSLITLLPQGLPEGSRTLVIGLMPLAALAVSMTAGVWGVQRWGALPVVTGGFLLSAVCVLGLWAVPSSPVLMVALAGAMGFVQGASFAQVPELNARRADQALATGGLAQTGNLGNTLGTPVMQGAGALMLPVAALILLAGAGLQLWAAARRRGATPP